MTTALPIALSTPSSSDQITETLGLVAVFAFLAIAVYIVFLYIYDIAREKELRSAHRLQREEEARKTARFDEAYAAELHKAEEGFRDYYARVLFQALGKFEDLAKHARFSLRSISDSYGVNSMRFGGIEEPARTEKYVNVCSRQWKHFEAELPFMTFSETESELRHILESHRFLEAREHDDLIEANISSEMLRMQEIISLADGVTKDRIARLQGEMLESIEPFCEYYQGNVRVWLTDQIVHLINKMKERSDSGITIFDTDMADSFRQLKNSMETISRLSERLAQDTQEIEEGSIAFSQIVYVGTALNIIGELDAWFPRNAETAGEEVAPGRPVEEPARLGTELGRSIAS